GQCGAPLAAPLTAPDLKYRVVLRDLDYFWKPGPGFSADIALRAYSRARSTASSGVATETNSFASTPAFSIGHVRRPNTVFPRSNAWAISLKVPYERFTAMIASDVRTMIRFRAVLLG